MFAYVINGGHTLIINVMVCPDKNLVRRFMDMDGNFTKRIHRFTSEERANMYLVDLFFNDSEYTNGDYIYDAKYGLKLTNYIESMRPKLAGSRIKDLYDY